MDNITDVDNVLQSFPLNKALRIGAWMRRFAHNALRSSGTEFINGPFSTAEIQLQKVFWTKKSQESCDLEVDVALNLQPGPDGVLRCVLWSLARIPSLPNG